VEAGDGDGAAPSTRKPTTLMAGCVWLTDDSLLLGAGLLSIDCVLSLLGICANQELYSELSTQDERKAARESSGANLAATTPPRQAERFANGCCTSLGDDLLIDCCCAQTTHARAERAL